MTERKPPGMSSESWVDKQIREATERGEFDDLPGAGKPIPNLDKASDELWWIREKMRREGVETDALLPTPLRLRKEIDQLPDTVGKLASEQAVRDVVAKLNRRILDWIRTPSGPPVIITPVDVDDVVAQWHESRRPPERAPEPEPRPKPRRRWWRRARPGAG